MGEMAVRFKVIMTFSIGSFLFVVLALGLGGLIKLAQIYLVDPASSHMLVPKIKTWMSQDAYFPMLGFPSSAQAELRAGKLGLLRHKNSP